MIFLIFVFALDIYTFFVNMLYDQCEAKRIRKKTSTDIRAENGADLCTI